jgi:hypothetical protein
MIDLPKIELPSENLHFIVRCIEDYKFTKRLTGKATIELLVRYGVIAYLREFYESLHINGSRYMVEEIDLFIEIRRAKEAGASPSADTA